MDPNHTTDLAGKIEAFRDRRDLLLAGHRGECLRPHEGQCMVLDDAAVSIRHVERLVDRGEAVGHPSGVIDLPKRHKQNVEVIPPLAPTFGPAKRDDIVIGASLVSKETVEAAFLRITGLEKRNLPS